MMSKRQSEGAGYGMSSSKVSHNNNCNLYFLEIRFDANTLNTDEPYTDP